MEISFILLGVPTMFGDSEVVQTHIQLWGFVLAIFTLIALIVTLNMQRIAMIEQTKVNDLQNKIALRDLTPILEVEAEEMTHKGNWAGYVFLRVRVATCVVISCRFMKRSFFFEEDTDLLPSNQVPLHEGRHELKYIGVSNETIKTAMYLNSPENLDELKLEIVYTDQFNKFRYRSVFQMTSIYSNQPKFTLIEHQNI